MESEKRITFKRLYNIWKIQQPPNLPTQQSPYSTKTSEPLKNQKSRLTIEMQASIRQNAPDLPTPALQCIMGGPVVGVEDTVEVVVRVELVVMVVGELVGDLEKIMKGGRLAEE